MKKQYLLTPGPTPIPEAVLQAMNGLLPYHRSVGFQSVFSEVRSKLKELFQTQNEVLVLTSSGSGAMEAAAASLFKKDDAVLVINAGKFGERWVKLAQTYELQTHELKIERGKSPTVSEIKKQASKIPGLKAILFQASETSTGVQLPSKAITEIAHELNALSVCDAITALGVYSLPMDAWGIDVLITGSQKALMTPPGLAMIALSPKAQAALCSARSLYFDLGRELKQQQKNQTAWTPAISLILGLNAALDLILKDGLETTFRRHAILAETTRKAVKALNLELLSESPSAAVTAVKVPSSIPDGKQIPKLMRDQLGLTIAGGQDELEGKIFRLSHFGYCGPFDVLTAIGGLEIVLKQLGHSFKVGAGVQSVIESLSLNSEVFK